MKKAHFTSIIFGLILVTLISGCGGGSGSRGKTTPEVVREIVHYDGDESFVGSGGGDHYRDWLVYFNTTKLSSYIGYKLIGVRIHYHDYQFNPATHDYNIRLYGKGTTTQPGTELYKHDHTLSKGWNDVILPTPIEITSGMEIWAGFEVYTLNCWPLSHDANSPVPGVNFLKDSTQTDYQAVTEVNYHIRLILEK